MYELPSTGGPGDYLFTIIGISISFAIVLLKLRELKEERAA
jgi:LPXTG-motif cell wall-anchored protein